jgi:drug/metabolite transporter (DMT)-like permease
VTKQQKALLAVLVVAFLGGSTGVFVKIGVQVIPPITFVFLRFLMASLLLVPFVNFKKINRRYLPKVAILSLLLAANIVIFAFGIKETTAVMGSILYMFTPVLVALFAYLFFGKKLSGRKTFGLTLGFVGAFFLVGLPVLQQATEYSGTLRGNLMVFTAVTTFALYSVLIKEYQKYYSSLFITFVFTVLTTLVMASIALPDLLSQPAWFAEMTRMTWTAVAFIGIGGGALLYLTYQYAIEYGTSLSASMMSFIQPIAGAIMAFLLLGEKLTLNILLGSIPVFVGAWLVTVGSKSEDKSARAS